LAALYFRKGLLIIPLVVLMNYPQDSYAYEWQDLWHTPDQQAQQAFNKQQYGQAAAQFQSPEWQAAAQYKAEKYQEAAETLQPLEHPSADIYYNQATALAKAGKLEQALKTYQKALQLNPEHQDALYNKNLVEEALQKQDKDKQQSDSSKQKQNDDQNRKSSDQSNDQQAQQDKQSEDATSDQANQDQQEQNKETDKAQQQAEDELQKATDAEQKDQAKQAESEQASKQQQDAQKESAQQQTDQQANDDSEQKQAQEQWLKRIPDDPAGLLKRKFKYQYSQRNQSTQQEKTW
jgi:Ca-activated chloride channel family protein